MRREDLLDLNDVLQHPGRELAVDISTELADEEDLDLLKPLEGYLEAVSTGNLLLITGKFTGKIVFECARCGGPLEKDLEFEIEEQFAVEGTPSSLNTQDYARVVADEPVPMFDGNSLLVEALLRQQLLVELPMQALCEYGWDGACPVATARAVATPESPHGRPEFEKLSRLLPQAGGVGRSALGVGAPEADGGVGRETLGVRPDSEADGGVGREALGVGGDDEALDLNANSERQTPSAERPSKARPLTPNAERLTPEPEGPAS